MRKSNMLQHFQDSDPADRSFQHLEDLATAYWYSEVFFISLELDLYHLIDQGHKTTSELALVTHCEPQKLERFLQVLKEFELIGYYNDNWYNQASAAKYLVKGKSSYLGEFLHYRKYMQPGWMNMLGKLSSNKQKDKVQTGEDIKAKTFNYVKAMDALACEKAKEIVELLKPISINGPILDIAGGAGALGRALVSDDTYCDLFELPDVIEVAKSLYSKPKDWRFVNPISGDFRFHPFAIDKQYELVLLSNFLHAYDAKESVEHLAKATELLSEDGVLLIHDYFPDRKGRSPHKGRLYDLNMLINTYNGTCHNSSNVIQWLTEKGLKQVIVRDLPSDSSVILASKRDGTEWLSKLSDQASCFADMVYSASDVGFRKAVVLPTDKIVTAPWVRKKCQFGCSLYQKGLQCPPNGMEFQETRQLLDSYNWAIILEGHPPGHQFHEKLLELEREAFLEGYHKAFAFSAGPCTVCDSCAIDRKCQKPDEARPSMEGSGIDVYQTTENAGIRLAPVKEKTHYVKYIGLLLLK